MFELSFRSLDTDIVWCGADDSAHWQSTPFKHLIVSSAPYKLSVRWAPRGVTPIVEETGRIASFESPSSFSLYRLLPRARSCFPWHYDGQTYHVKRTWQCP